MKAILGWFLHVLFDWILKRVHAYQKKKADQKKRDEAQADALKRYQELQKNNKERTEEIKQAEKDFLNS